MDAPVMMFVKPVNPETTVIDPATDLPISFEGQSVPKTKYWLRRIEDGTVVVVPPKSDKK